MNDFANKQRDAEAAEAAQLRTDLVQQANAEQALRESLVVLAELLAEQQIPTRRVFDRLESKRFGRDIKHYEDAVWLLVHEQWRSGTGLKMSDWVYLRPDGTIMVKDTPRYVDSKVVHWTPTDDKIAAGIVCMLAKHNLVWPDDAPDLTQHFTIQPKSEYDPGCD